MPRRNHRDKVTPARSAVGAKDEVPIEHGLWQRLWNLSAQFRESHDTEKLLKAALRVSLDHFGADIGSIVHIPPGKDVAELIHSTGRGATWDLELLGGFLRGYEVSIPPELMAARIRRNGRMWGALVVSSPSAKYDWKNRQAHSAIGAAATSLIEIMDRERAREVRSKIDQEILAQRKPKDLFYKLLHGIRSLTNYDHSSALLTFTEGGQELELVAEQIAWRKAKSQRVGAKFPLPTGLRQSLENATVIAFDRRGSWTARDGQAPAPLAELLDYDARAGMTMAEPRVGCLLCAPLVTKEGALGVLKIAALHNESFGDYEIDLVAQFLPQAAVILRNMKRTESLEMQVLAAERKHAMANLARGVSHDVNNALGAVLPLVQQLRDDLRGDGLDPDVAEQDLEEIERSLQVCRRIFGGMLGFARSAVRNPSEVHLFHEVETTLGILREGLTKRGIAIEVNVPESLPPLRAVQADVEQLLLNLIGNARDAMSVGDQLTITARPVDHMIELSVKDTGCGIAASDLTKVQEPFYTTKATGNGLGLAICRSIVAEMRGRLSIASVPNEGTDVRVLFPVLEERST